MTQRFTLAKEEYLHTFQLMTPTMCDTPPVSYPPFFATPQQQPMYVPAWSAVQLGPLPSMPSTQPTTPAPFPVPPTPVGPPAPFFLVPPTAMPMHPIAPPVAPPQYASYSPGRWVPMPNHYPAPAQPYPICYPLALWPSYQ